MSGFIFYAALLLLADILTKIIAACLWFPGRWQPVIPALLSFTYLENQGAAFGLLPNMRWLLALVALVVLVIIVWYVAAERCRSRWQYSGFIFIFAGTAGNLLDRFFRGYVVDFVYIPCLPKLPIFNLADVFINIGVLLLIVYVFQRSGQEN